MELLDLIQNRRSYRKFKPTAVEEEKIKKLTQAALMAPAGKRFNEWEFVVVTDKETLKKLSESKDGGADFVADAPLAIVVLTDRETGDIQIEDASIAATFIWLEAADLDLGACWVQTRNRKDKDGRPSQDCVREILGIPERYEVQCMMAIGYKDQERKPYDKDKLAYEKIHRERF